MSDAEQHKAEMKKLQAEQRAKVAEATDPEQGLVLVHTGNGKGKSKIDAIAYLREFKIGNHLFFRHTIINSFLGT